MTEEVMLAEREMDLAAEQLAHLPGSAPLSKRKGAEYRYGRAYQQLVRLGARRQLREKYRRMTS